VHNLSRLAQRHRCYDGRLVMLGLRVGSGGSNAAHRCDQVAELSEVRHEDDAVSHSAGRTGPREADIRVSQVRERDRGNR
jgi:hypothetical protein